MTVEYGKLPPRDGPPPLVLRNQQPSVLAIDPGYRTLGWCYLREGVAPPDAPSALHRIADYGRLDLRAEALPARLHELRHGVRELIEGWKPGVVAVELPAIAGAYRRHGKRAEASVQLLHYAIGVVIACAAHQRGPENVLTMRASGTPKPKRHVWLASQFRLAKLPLPQGCRGGELPDVLDAVWIGCQVLRTPDWSAVRST